jgi:hypothetical protein
MFKYEIVKSNPPINGSDFVLRTNTENGEVSSIPMVETNADYIVYLAWVAEGNTAEEWQPESEGN